MRRILIIAGLGLLCACHSEATPSVDDLTPADASSENAVDGAASLVLLLPI
jgi:hypothetical protein